MKPRLIGELNPYGANPRYALYPLPERSAGHRLCHKVLGYEFRLDYLLAFERFNLCTGKWSAPAARERAALFRAAPCPTILLGSKVAKAFGLPYRPFEEVAPGYLVLPHPSGLCRAWNEPGAYARAQLAVREFLAKNHEAAGTSENGVAGAAGPVVGSDRD